MQLAIEDQVEAICETPLIGEPKTGDLSGFYVWKFRFNQQQYLIAYLPPTKEQLGDATLIEFLGIDFYKVDTHENFYNELKRYVRN